MVNLATYIGSSQAGIPGAIIATAAVVAPAFIIILLIMAVLKTALKNPYVQAGLNGIKPCIVGIIAATGIDMIFKNCFSSSSIDSRAVIMTVFLGAIVFLYKKMKKKNISPILLIIISAVTGIAAYSF